MGRPYSLLSDGDVFVKVIGRIVYKEDKFVVGIALDVLGDIEGEFVVSTGVLSDLLPIDEDGSLVVDGCKVEDDIF